MPIYKDFGAINIKDFGAKGDNLKDDAKALINALEDSSSNTIVIPDGIYLIGKDVNISSNKKIVFVGGMLKPLSGVTVKIDGTWEAGRNEQIFDLSSGGIIDGNFKIDEIYPEWLGAKGDGTTDDSKAFNDAAKLCKNKRIIKLAPKSYKIRSTIEGPARGIKGTAQYIDGTSGGSNLSWDPIDKTTDLLPCIRISQGGRNSDYRDFSIHGTVSYNTQDLANWVDKTLFEQDKYEMFAVGTAAIDIVGGATPVFTNVKTGRVKVGLLLNSTDGHITSYDCNWSGLIGVYCRRNTEDYFFQGGGINGAFCGIMLGIILQSNHYGGMSITMNRVHMGFSPYGIYQVKDAPNYDSLPSVAGLAAILKSTRFERCGEAAIKLLPKSSSGGIQISGFGFTWSPHVFTSESDPGWTCPLPDGLMAADQRQKYAVYLGTIGNRVELLFHDAGGVYKSNAPGAIGSAYIEMLDGSANLIGLDIPNVTIKRKLPKVSVELNTPQAVEQILSSRHINPISSGNLMKNPEDITSWKLSGTGTGELSIVSNLSSLPVPFSAEMKKFAGDNIKVLKYTPDGTNGQMPTLISSVVPLALDPNRTICYSYFIYSPRGSVRSRIASSGVSLYDTTYTTPVNDWYYVYCRGSKAADIREIQFFALSTTEPTYIAAVTAHYDEITPYSPYKHAYTTMPIETTDGIILNSGTQKRYKVTATDDGGLSIIDLTGAIATNNYSTISKVKTLPEPNASQRGRVITIEGDSNVKAVVNLLIKSPCTVAGNLTLTLDGVETIIPVTPAQNTATFVLNEIKKQSFPNWTYTNDAYNITFTHKEFGSRIQPTFSGGDTGVTATLTFSKQGSIGTSDSSYICKKLHNDSYIWSEI